MRRDHALDAMRGLALLGMALSGLVPWGTLPAWMYHAQLPPPTHQLDIQRFGIHWVDLVFPFFLLAMGAAIPLSLERKIPAADAEDWIWRWLKLIGGITVRAAGLMLFAVCVHTFRGSAKPAAEWQWMVLLYFAGMALTWVRLPNAIPTVVSIGMRVIGASVIFFGLLTEGVRAGQYDPILMVLANVYLTGALIWLACRSRPSSLIFAMVAVGGVFLASSQPGLSRSLMGLNWGFGQSEFQKYLLVVLPGFALGSLRRTKKQGGPDIWAGGVASMISLIALAGVPLGLTQFRDAPLLTVFTVLFAVNALWLVRGDEVLRPVHRWGWGLLVIGLILEPLGGGIRKDWATISYLLVTPGLGILLYGALRWLHERLGHSDFVEVSDLGLSAFSRSVRGLVRVSDERPGFLALVGQNPMLGYIVITSLAWATVRLSGLHAWQNGQPWSAWERAVYGMGVTVAIGAVIATLSRLKFFVRA